MLFVKNPSLDPWFNLAAEEYLLKHLDEEVVMLWQSRSSVIVGKHQNTLSEINYPFVKQEKIPVIRRLSGGGTVFHGPGNLNFTFIRKAPRDRLIDFRKHTRPVIAFLESIGVPARFEGKNDLRLKGLKISGNAEHVFKNKVLHHGTLLFNSDLNRLNQAIKVGEGRYKDRSVQSVRSRVANISSFLEQTISFEVFHQKLGEFLRKYFGNTKEYVFSEKELETIENLSREKYNTWEWNFGYSPDYLLSSRAIIDGEPVELRIMVKKGIIETAGFLATGDRPKKFETLARDMEGRQHRESVLCDLMVKHRLIDAESTDLPDEWIRLFF